MNEHNFERTLMKLYGIIAIVCSWTRVTVCRLLRVSPSVRSLPFSRRPLCSRLSTSSWLALPRRDESASITDCHWGAPSAQGPASGWRTTRTCGHKLHSHPVGRPIYVLFDRSKSFVMARDLNTTHMSGLPRPSLRRPVPWRFYTESFGQPSSFQTPPSCSWLSQCLPQCGTLATITISCEYNTFRCWADC